MNAVEGRRAEENAEIAPAVPAPLGNARKHVTLIRVVSWLLAGEVAFVFLDVLEPKLLPVLLKVHGATDRQIAFIVGTINSFLQILLMAPVGYFSDRLRTAWGRRTPLLICAVPLAGVFLAMIPFSQEIATWASSVPLLRDLLGSVPAAPAIVCFGVVVFFFRSAQTVVNSMFFGLVRDVVPETHMGRFLAFFRLAGAASTFVVTYGLLRIADTHSKTIFVSVAVVATVTLCAMCWFIKERPCVPEGGGSGGGTRAFGAGSLRRIARVFMRESYSHAVYLWCYGVRICIYGALLGVSGFMIFFPQQELGLTLADSAELLAWPCLLWLVLAYPVGRLLDAWGAMRVLWHALAVTSTGYLLSFFLVVGAKTFFVSSLITGLGFWTVMLAQLKMTQEIFHPRRYSQLAGANTIVQGVVIAAVLSPAVGWLLHTLQDWEHVWSLPGVGPLVLGPYRFLNLIMALLYGIAWIGLVQTRKHWQRLGGPSGYVAPL